MDKLCALPNPFAGKPRAALACRQAPGVRFVFRTMAKVLFLLLLAVSTVAGDWPQFRGPRRDGVSVEKGLLQSWPAEGPKALWSTKNLGRGYSCPTIVDDRIYITGDVGEEVHLFALDLSGKQVWTATNGAAWKDPYPGARSTITFSDGKLYHQNAQGQVTAFNTAGKQLWSVDLLKTFDGANITWGMSECLLVDDRAVYTTAGGKGALVVALDKHTGKTLWKTPGNGESASYVSPTLVEIAGRKLIVGCSSRSIYCVDAATGQLQWTKPMPTAYSVIALPPAVIGDAVFMTAPHGKGGRLWKLASGEEIWSTTLDTCQGGVVQAGDKLIGSFYPGRKGWAAVSTKTGEIVYQQQDCIKGAPLFADNRLYALSEDGAMRLVEVGENGFVKHGEFQLARAQNDAWAHPVILNGRLYLRYHETLNCYDIKK